MRLRRRGKALQFTKMQGAGNDYVYVNGFVEEIPSDLPALARAIADRRFGVGADGLILVLPSTVADARMRMFNADGSEAEMCGNGIRCVAKLMVDRRIAFGPVLKIETLAGIKSAKLIETQSRESQVEVDMGIPRLAAELIPTTLPGDESRPERPVVNFPVVVEGGRLEVTCVSMGNPHAVVYVDHATDELVHRAGPILESHEVFPEGANIEFVEVLSPSEVRQRTWERGSGETLACGTGASAVCVAGVLTGKTSRQLLVHLRGGDLRIEWAESTNAIHMTGPAVEVFTGEWPEP